MAKEICISSTPHETRLAILEDDQLSEIYYERENEYTLAGSVYKGRVTRVLPGMQSAFVDIGLERDAFLYVTDFLEMEDPEDSDEVERAATTGSTQRPQAQQGQRSGRGDGRNNESRSSEARGEEGRGEDRVQGRNQDRSRRSPRIESTSVESEQPTYAAQETPRFSVTPVGEEPSVPSSVADATVQQDETDEQGARRWRGRRRRRGGRGRDEAGREQSAAPVSDETQPEETFAEEIFEEPFEAEPQSLNFEASASTHVSGRSIEPAPSGAPAPFVLPGESLSKYGGGPVLSAPSKLVFTELPPDTAPAAPPRTVTKPSTLVEDEIVWDGKGLLPGESLARHRAAVSHPVHAEPSGIFADVAASRHEEPVKEAPSFEFEEFVEAEMPSPEEKLVEVEFTDNQPAAEVEAEAGLIEASAAEVESEARHVEGFAPEDRHVVHEAEVDAIAHEAQATSSYEPETLDLGQHLPLHHEGASAEHEAHAHETHMHDDHEEHAEPADAEASHNVDPLPPSSFRLKDLFGSRRREEESETHNITPPPTSGTPKSVNVSAYAPGTGLVEEEVIEDEEYEFTPLKAHGDEHDLEELEEETLQQQIRSGALGEMLQEAHLDHRIEVESEEDDDTESDEEEEVSADGRQQPAGSQPGRGRSDNRGDRGGRGRGRNGRQGGGGSGDNRDGRRPSRRSAQTTDLPIISDLLKPGQEILVQIAKEPIAKKGARITSHIALPGRFLVFMPTVSHVGVSRKIASDEERQRLKRILVSEKGEATGGFIVRTAADGATEEELRADLRFLINLWNDIKQRSDSSRPPALIYHDLSLIERILRDQVSDNFSHIWVDSEADYERIVRFLNRFSPELVRRVKLYTKEIPLFEHFGIQDEISKALRSKVWLKSGGSIVINQTEALVAIDINTGKFVGKTARLEDTILKTNLDAIPEIVRQIRLRDLGGIIVIDFIDMDERKNRARVMAALEEALKQDRAPTKVLQFNDFGLVAITRKRVKQSLERTLSVPCPVCQATGMVKSPATVANEIYIEVRKMRKHFDQTEVLVRVNPETAKALKANNARWLTELEDLAGKNVLIKSDATLHPEQFDIQG